MRGEKRATPTRGVAGLWDSGEKPLCHRHPRRPTPFGIRWDRRGTAGRQRVQLWRTVSATSPILSFVPE